MLDAWHPLTVFWAPKGLGSSTSLALPFSFWHTVFLTGWSWLSPAAADILGGTAHGAGPPYSAVHYNCTFTSGGFWPQCRQAQLPSMTPFMPLKTTFMICTHWQVRQPPWTIASVCRPWGNTPRFFCDDVGPFIKTDFSASANQYQLKQRFHCSSSSLCSSQQVLQPQLTRTTGS